MSWCQRNLISHSVQISQPPFLFCMNYSQGEKLDPMGSGAFPN